MRLKPWRLSGMLTSTRTIGEIGLRKNGTALDIWLRVDGQPRWFGVHRQSVQDFLESSDQERVIKHVDSDGNAEETSG